MARQPVLRQRAVVRRLPYVHVRDGPQPRRLVERACGDADRLAARRIPEEARAARAAEAMLRAALAGRARDPTQCSLLDELHVLAARRGRREEMPAPPAALDAVADEHVAQRAAHLVADRAAEAAAGRAHSSDSASRVDTSATRIPVPAARTPSSSITVQNGHATASVSAPVSAASRTRASLIALPRSSIHMCAPPAPQQNVCLPLRFISTGWPITFRSFRGSVRTSLCRAR